MIAPLAPALASSAPTRAFARITAGSSGGPECGETPRSRDLNEVVFGQGLRARHQLDVRVPEALGVLGALHQFGGAAGKIDADERPMAEDIAHAVAELIAHLGDPLVSRAAIGACVAAIFDERDGGVRRTENVIGLVVHWPIEPIARRQVRHARHPICLRRR